MLKGLEVVEIRKSKLNQTLRIESEYYRKSYLKVEFLLAKKKSETLSTISVKVTDGTHFTPNYVVSGVPFLSALNILENRLDLEAGHRFIALAEHNELYRRCDPIAGDVLLRKIGVGPRWAAVVPADLPVFSIFVSVALVRPKIDLISSEVLAVFINSTIGQSQLLRVQKGASQPDLHLEDIRDIFIPVFGDFFQKIITKTYQTAGENLKESVACYKRAENLLLNSLGMADFTPSSETVNIKSFKGSFGISGRLDAEGYQAKYDDYRSLLASYPNGYGFLSDVCQVNNNNFTPIDNNKYQYIELSDIDLTGCINSCTTAQGIDLPSRARRVVAANDVLVSSVEGSLSSCALVPLKYDGALCSTGFYVLRSDKINSETLLILFKSELMQNLLKQGCTGTILTAINKEEFFSLPVPIIDITAQQQIAQLVQQSFALKAQSEHLLDVAKRAVEIAIEQDEAAALSYIAHEVKDGSE